MLGSYDKRKRKQGDEKENKEGVFKGLFGYVVESLNPKITNCSLFGYCSQFNKLYLSDSKI